MKNAVSHLCLWPGAGRPCGSINGAGVESIQTKWAEMFGEKKEEVVEKVKVKKPPKKANKTTATRLIVKKTPVENL